MGGILGGLIGSLGLTVPAAPSAPSVSSPNANQDNVSWIAPSNGGSPILLYYWESDDGKSGTAATTSAIVSQEAGTGQRYRVRAQNAVGLGDWSPYSILVTTTFSFAPFSFAPCPPLYTILYQQPSCTSGLLCTTYADGSCGMWAECVRC